VGEANERGREEARARGHEGGKETIRVRGRVRGRGRRGRETAGNGVRHHHASVLKPDPMPAADQRDAGPYLRERSSRGASGWRLAVSGWGKQS